MTPIVKSLLRGLVVVLGVLLLEGGASAAPAELQVWVLALEKGTEAFVDPKLEKRPEIRKGLENTAFNRVRLLRQLTTTVNPTTPRFLQIPTPQGKKETLEFLVLEEGDGQLKLQTRCKGLRGLNAKTTYRPGGTLMLVEPKVGLGLAIRWSK